MAPRSPNSRALIEALRSTLAHLEQEPVSTDALSELRRSIVLAIAELDMREGEPGLSHLIMNRETSHDGGF